MSSDFDSAADEISFELPHIIRLHRSGRVERLFADTLVPPSLDHSTGVQSKDVVISLSTGLSVRLYLPPSASSADTNLKIPVLITCHGGAFCIVRSSSSIYHNYVNNITAKAGVLTVSVDYRLAPENPLPIAYEDAWEALQWVFSCSDPWLSKYGDMDRVFLGGESAGANIAHNLAMRLGSKGEKVEGLVLVHPFFWGQERIGNEIKEPNHKVDHPSEIWMIVCPGTTGLDDPWINPVAEGAPSLATLGCYRALVCVAEFDLFKDRGKVYYETLKESGWEGEVAFFETDGEDHGFFFKLECEKSEEMFQQLVNFFNKA
ncbi:hypothetical protein HPP92_011182 [Vanilla planifolia]|uniref:Alpha/beta hydrolase fold-3 domain-containing protein n=1 Tax=Vanilla planifolia TaxID=51239 RepID=A0A835UY77_VANPL|nr:hypothetical protein HPP92_011182 [Vanilla planifolia]